MDLEVAGAAVSFTDDLLAIEIEAASPEAAIGPVTDLVNRLLPVVSFGLEQLIGVAFIQAIDQASRQIRFRSEVIERFGTYNLAAVRGALEAVPQQVARAAGDAAPIPNAGQPGRL